MPLKKYLFILREREREQAGERQRETDRESQAGYAAVSAEPEVGLKPTDHEIMT